MSFLPYKFYKKRIREMNENDINKNEIYSDIASELKDEDFPAIDLMKKIIPSFTQASNAIWSNYSVNIDPEVSDEAKETIFTPTNEIINESTRINKLFSELLNYSSSLNLIQEEGEEKRKRGRPPKNPSISQPKEDQNAGENINTKFDFSALSDSLKNLISLFNDSLETQIELKQTVEDKYKEIYNLAYRVAIGRANKSFAFICGTPGVGKTYSVEQAMIAAKQKLPSWQFKFYRGSIGKSVSALIAFFWLHQENHIIVLDDCDGMLTESSQEIINILKAALDTDNPVISTGSPAIRKLVSNVVKGELGPVKSEENEEEFEEKIKPSLYFDFSRFSEDIITVYDKNKNLLLEEKVDPTEKHYLNKIFFEKTKYVNNKMLDLDFFNEKKRDEDDDDDWLIPETFLFNSRIIFVSNLYRHQIPDAVASRVLIAELNLSQEEIMERIATILPYFKLRKTTSISNDEWNWAKICAYKYMSAIVEAANTTGYIPTPKGNLPVKITTPIDFRLFMDVTGAWIEVADEIEPGAYDLYKGDSQKLYELELKIAIPFITKRLLNYLNQGSPSQNKKKKK